MRIEVAIRGEVDDSAYITLRKTFFAFAAQKISEICPELQDAEVTRVEQVAKARSFEPSNGKVK